MPTPKPQIRSLFATPVCVHFLSIAAEMNPELRQLVLEKAQSVPGARGQGWRSTPDFESWGGGHAQTLFRVLRELADSLTSTRTGARVTLDWQIQASAAVRQSGDYQEMAARPGSMWSGVYYVDDGYAKSDDAALGGECELADPRGVLPAMVAPHLAFRIPGGQAAGRSELIRPQSGMILLHPSWQPRGERRCDGPSPRVAIEFDVAAPAQP
ncbi:MAG TPA: putative 2OG-Fe(II) oxygenase [Rhizomicrobium sp.]|nr:putative 2OG-Fe(II) oxygenase [Rhizomicrobium sp.]